MSMTASKALIFGLGSAVFLSLGGCSGYDVELKGGVFDVLGVSNLNKKKGDPKLVSRGGLVVPPSTASLPVPGSGSTVAAAAPGSNWPVDPEQSKADKKRLLLEKHAAFCEAARRRVKIGLDAAVADGPLGSCHESVMKNFTGKDAYRRESSNLAAKNKKK